MRVMRLADITNPMVGVAQATTAITVMGLVLMGTGATVTAMVAISTMAWEVRSDSDFPFINAIDKRYRLSFANSMLMT